MNLTNISHLLVMNLVVNLMIMTMLNVLVIVCVLINITVQRIIFKFSVISSEFVHDQICDMHNNKSAGLDQFSVRLLKLAGPFISNCLAHICNLSLSGSTFPDDWKKAKVTPIFKSGDKQDVGNYRSHLCLANCFQNYCTIWFLFKSLYFHNFT